MHEVKEFKSFSEQVDILRSRGLIIDSREDAMKKLSNINYYRFTAYLLSYKIDEINYIEGTNFETIFRLYTFDKELRNIISSALEDVEIAFRTYIAYTIAEKYNPLGHLDSNNFNDKKYYCFFRKELKKMIKNNCEKPFIKHHMIKRSGKIPVWAAVEVMSFGMISRLYSNMKDSDKLYIRDNFCYLPIQKVENWLKALTILRNQCAHFGRIYNYNFPEISIHKDFKKYDIDNEKVFSNILAIKKLLCEDNWASFLFDLMGLMNKYEKSLDLELIGFPSNWLEILAKK